MDNELLHIKDLTKSYDRGKSYVLKGVNIKIYEGEFVVILGPNGAGKTTLLSCINRLREPTSGDVYFRGESIIKAKGRNLRAFRASIGVIFQHNYLVDRTDVINNVLHGCLGRMSLSKSIFSLYSKEDKDKAKKMLENFGLIEDLNKKAINLSGGQMKIVAICRAFMQNPQILLADEPISSLAPLWVDKIMEYIKKANTEESLTCLVNLHQVNIAKKYATRVIGMKAGEIVYDGVPENLSDEVIKKLYS